jgi:hypothetical protein
MFWLARPKEVVMILDIRVRWYNDTTKREMYMLEMCQNVLVSRIGPAMKESRTFRYSVHSCSCWAGENRGSFQYPKSVLKMTSTHSS